MKKNLALIVLSMILLSTSACKKCYYCHNSCSVCQNANFYILVQSDVLGTQYYNTYIDSLTGTLGYTCRDTAFTKQEDICGQKGDQINNTINTDEAAGWTCVPTNN